MSSGLILINVWSTKTDRKRKLIGGNIATYPDFLPSRLILVNIWSAYTDRKRKLIGGNNATYAAFLPVAAANLLPPRKGEWVSTQLSPQRFW